MKATPIKSYEYQQIRQPISGYPQWFNRREVWRIEIQIGNRMFRSATTYKDYTSAARAAKSITQKHKEDAA